MTKIASVQSASPFPCALIQKRFRFIPELRLRYGPSRYKLAIGGILSGASLRQFLHRLTLWPRLNTMEKVTLNLKKVEKLGGEVSVEGGA